MNHHQVVRAQSGVSLELPCARVGSPSFLSMFRPRSVHTAVATALLACQVNQAASAQVLYRTHDAFDVGAQPEWYTGMGDVNRDGTHDYLVAGRGVHPLGGASGVGAFDGPSGAAIWFTPHRAAYTIVLALSTIGDLNGDGIHDVAVASANIGIPGLPGSDACTFLSGADGSYLSEIIVYSQAGFPAPQCLSVLGLDDISGDGIPDVLLQVTDSRYRAYSGAPGHAPLYDVPGSVGGSSDQDVLEDVNGDGKRDFAVWYSSTAQPPAMRVHSGATGAILYSLSDSYWHAGVHDVNGDGQGDLATNSAGPLIGGAPYSYVVMRSGVDGSPIWTTTPAESIANGAHLGLYMQSGGDVNGDGYDDLVSVDQFLAVGVIARVVSGKTGAVLVDIDPDDVRGPSGCGPLGFENTRILGDLDGDGYAEFAASQPLFNECNPNLNPLEWGRVYIFRGGPYGDTTWLCDPPVNSTGSAARLNPIGAPAVGSPHMKWFLYNAPPLQFTQLAYGLALGAGQMPITIGSGQLCFGAQGAQRMGPPLRLDAGGTIRISAAWSNPTVAMNWTAGTTWVIQAVFRDHLDPTRANTSNALQTYFY